MPHISWYFMLLALIMYGIKSNNSKMFKFSGIAGILLFLVCSTSYVPKKLIYAIEKTYSPIEPQKLDTTKFYYIHVLGAGTSLDTKLPATMNLSTTTLTRLIEGIRVFNHLQHAILVTSAASKDENHSQAEVAKEAAILLGINEQKIQMLATPTSTLEEAIAFKEKFGTNKNVIIVTSALHMPRAVEIFKDQDIRVLAAPTDYLYKEDDFRYSGITLPTLNSLDLVNSYLTTVAKHFYYKYFKKKQKQ
ncbi:YdcF family protein [Flavobacterium sp. KS-LB2]|uniref:YdcF family protein n=1 Tax=Flavobacterium sp. KS-LB2 TaxID=3120525 RepID=UPI0030CDBE16